MITAVSLIPIALGVLAVVLLVFLLIRRKSAEGFDEFDVDGLKVTMGPAVEMSGPEFLAMLEAQGGDADPNAEHLYIEIPEAVMPMERGEKYEDPLEETLSEHSLGEVTGGGSMLSSDKAIEYVGIDVTVHDLKKSLPVIAAKMRELGAPRGTVIRYGEDGTAPFDIWS